MTVKQGIVNPMQSCFSEKRHAKQTFTREVFEKNRKQIVLKSGGTISSTAISHGTTATDRTEMDIYVPYFLKKFSD